MENRNTKILENLKKEINLLASASGSIPTGSASRPSGLLPPADGVAAAACGLFFDPKIQQKRE